jgi:hypothetical protein
VTPFYSKRGQAQCVFKLRSYRVRARNAAKLCHAEVIPRYGKGSDGEGEGLGPAAVNTNMEHIYARLGSS